MSFPAKNLQKSQSASELSMNPKVQGSRREKLMGLKQREELKDVLMFKLKEKYGRERQRADNEDCRSVTSSCIGREVDRFVGNSKVSEANLARLERRIQKRSAGLVRDDDACSMMSQVSMYSKPASIAGSVMSRGSQGSRMRSRSSSAMGLPAIAEGHGGASGIQDYDWSKLDEYAAFLHEQDALRQKAGVMSMQQKLRLDLDRQVADQRVKKQRQQDEEQKYYMNQLVEIEQWKDMERMRSEDMHLKAHKEKRDRDDQLQYERMLKEDAVNHKKVEEAELVSKIAREMEMEKARMDTKKHQQKQAMKKVFAENMSENAQKDEVKKQQVELDNEAMKEYNRILDQQEEMRAQELQSRMDKQKALMEKMKDGVQKQQKAKGDQDAQRAAAQKEEADARAIEMERNKEAKLKEMRHDTQSFLFKQMAEKDEKKEQSLELKRLQASILEADTHEYMDMEKRKGSDRRVRNVEHRFGLEAQIAQKASVKKFAMSGAEIGMNRQLLELVDKTLQERDDFMASQVQDEEADGEGDY